MNTTATEGAATPIVFLVEESLGMGQPWGNQKRSKSEGVALVLNGFFSRLPEDLGLLVGLMAYSSNAGGGPEVNSRWAGQLAGSEFVPVARLHRAPLSIQTRTVGSGENSRVEQLPIWYEPRAGGQDRGPQLAAFGTCETWLAGLRDSEPALAAAVIIHITTGDSSDGSPSPALDRLRHHTALGGEPMVVHVHLASTRIAEPSCYPSDASEAFPPEARSLFAMATTLTAEWRAAAEQAGFLGGAGRGVILHAHNAELLKLLKTVELLARSRALASAERASPGPAPAGTRIRWEFPPPTTKGMAPSPTRRPLRTAPVMAPDGKVLLCLQDRLIALKPGGKLDWSYPTGGFIPGAPALGRDGVVRVHSSDGLLHGVALDGTRAWPPIEVGEPLGRATPVVDEAGNTWICAATGGLLGIDAEGRSRGNRPYYRSRCSLNSPGLIHQNVFYVGGEDHCVHAIRLDETQGRNLWDHDAGRGRTGWYLNSGPALGPGPTIVVPSFDQHLYAFRLDGSIAWRIRLPGLARGSPVVDPSGRIYLGVSRRVDGASEAGALAAVDGTTGAMKLLILVDEPVESTPVIGDDQVVYFGDNAGLIRAVDPAGAPLWQFAVGAPVRSPGMIVEPGLVAFGRDDGSLVALPCSSSGAVQGWPRSNHADPPSSSVDEGAGPRGSSSPPLPASTPEDRDCGVPGDRPSADELGIFDDDLFPREGAATDTFSLRFNHERAASGSTTTEVSGPVSDATTDEDADPTSGRDPKGASLNARLPEPTPTRADSPSSAEPGRGGAAPVRRFGDYELLREIDRGGMGVVYLARQIGLNRVVALKMIRSGHLASPAEVRRFYVEAETVARLDHPNIVPIYEVGRHSGRHYFSMKYVEGGNLSQRIERILDRPASCASLIAAVARAVDYIHQRGLLHRDLKPSNILIDDRGQPHLTDFGLAKWVEGQSSLTEAGTVLGSPSYMSPEQASSSGESLTASSDVYSLGAIFYEMLAGRPPFRAGTPLETLRLVLDRDPEPPSSIRAGIDSDLQSICLKCLRKDLPSRYESARSLANDLEKWLEKARADGEREANDSR